jgi:hypothetical protein
MNNQYEVLNPWADVDPIPLKGVAPRLDDFSGKRIGLFCNFKPTARQILSVFGEKLRERFPDCELSWYDNPRMGIAEIESERKNKFDEWIDQVDAVVLAVGD